MAFFNAKPGSRNGVTSCFKTNLNYVYSIMMVVSVPSVIVENARYVVILAHYLE